MTALLEIPLVNRTIATLVQLAANKMARVPREIAEEFAAVPRNERTIQVPTRHGAVRCLIYSPPSKSSAPAVYLNIHGGGYIVRVPELEDHICRSLAADAGVVVVSVDYDTAPQARFPVAIEQCVDVLNWIVETATAQGWDASRLVVGGQSAGGAIATGVARTARDAGGPRIALQILNYPPLDLTIAGSDKPSRAARPLISPKMSRLFDFAYAPNPDDRAHPLVSPASARNIEIVDGVNPLAGMPPTHIQIGELDTLREEDIRYADALRAAGVPVVCREFQGVDHAFNVRPPAGPARESVNLMVEQVLLATT